jgi:hypothetical protein
MKLFILAITITFFQLSLANPSNEAKLNVFEASPQIRSDYNFIWENMMLEYKLKHGKDMDPFLIEFKPKADLILANAMLKGKVLKSKSEIEKVAKQAQQELIQVLQALKKSPPKVKRGPPAGSLGRAAGNSADSALRAPPSSLRGGSVSALSGSSRAGQFVRVPGGPSFELPILFNPGGFGRRPNGPPSALEVPMPGGALQGPIRPRVINFDDTPQEFIPTRPLQVQSRPPPQAPRPISPNQGGVVSNVPAGQMRPISAIQQDIERGSFALKQIKEHLPFVKEKRDVAMAMLLSDPKNPTHQSAFNSVQKDLETMRDQLRELLGSNIIRQAELKRAQDALIQVQGRTRNGVSQQPAGSSPLNRENSLSFSQRMEAIQRQKPSYKMSGMEWLGASIFVLQIIASGLLLGAIVGLIVGLALKG